MMRFASGTGRLTVVVLALFLTNSASAAEGVPLPTLGIIGQALVGIGMLVIGSMYLRKKERGRRTK